MQIPPSEPRVDFSFFITKGEKKPGKINFINVYLTQQNKTMIVSTSNQCGSIDGAFYTLFLVESSRSAVCLTHTASPDPHREFTTLTGGKVPSNT